MLLISPYKLDCDIHATDGLENSFQIDIAAVGRYSNRNSRLSVEV
jgi:hypothetical protein